MKREPKLPTVIPEKMNRWRAVAKRLWNQAERFKKWHIDTEAELPEGLEEVCRYSELLYYQILNMELNAKRKTRNYEPSGLSETD